MGIDRQSVVVLGAGAVGVCCALELQRLGANVTLMDRKPPGSETSFGNAGVLSRSSLVPFNSPGLRAALPRMLMRGSNHLRINAAYLLRQAAWGKAFVANGRRETFNATCAALNSLIELSLSEHRRLVGLAHAQQHWRDTGWLMLYRSEAAFVASQLSRDTYAKFDVKHEVLDASTLQELEPHLAPIFERALWIQDAASVDDPGRVVQMYADLFVSRGGVLVQAEVEHLQPSTRNDGDWSVHHSGGKTTRTHRVVVALGPWSPTLLQRLNVRLPMAFERGYHMNYAWVGDKKLSRPVYDTGAGCVLSPMAQGLRLTTGVELNERDAPANRVQLHQAHQDAMAAFPMGEALQSEPWVGSRPTLPDSRPIIGDLPRLPGLWLALGHQHIGFSTSAGTAALLGALMFNQALPIAAAPFRAQRFVL